MNHPNIVKFYDVSLKNIKYAARYMRLTTLYLLKWSTSQMAL